MYLKFNSVFPRKFQMGVNEHFIGALITMLVEKLVSADLIRLARSGGVYSELNKWTDALTQIQVVLVDAGQKQIQDRPVQLWLNNLKYLAYEIDEVVDDLSTEAMRHQLNPESHASTSKSTISTKFDASKLDEITTKLLDLVKEKNLLGLNDKVDLSSRGATSTRQLEKTSLLPEDYVVGREGDKEALLGKLLSTSHCENVEVMSIVGNGGVGKTTLAQLLFNDKRVKEHFELMAWVCVSDEFDVYNISKAILYDISGDVRNFENLNKLQVALTEKVSKKRFLLVLDDVWNENYNEWALLQWPFYVAAPGSKFLVTTRKIKVASVMDSVQPYPLELLSDEEALSLFAHHASSKQNFDVNMKLKLHGGDIVKKCGRLPLPLVTLGRVFRTKSNEEEWEELLKSEIWNSHNNCGILPALRLCYYDLPSHVKQMFAYCSLFPKDFMFDKDELIMLWMAEGFLLGSNSSKSMVSFGRECFEELVSKSFFQHSTNRESQYIMHDMMNDLATSVADEFFFTLDDSRGVYIGNEALEKIHHRSFSHERYAVYKKFKALPKARRLRTFLSMPVTRLTSCWDTFHISKKLYGEVLDHLQAVEYLDFLECVELKYMWESEATACEILAYLQKLQVIGCENLISLGEKEVNQVISMEAVTEVRIEGCQRLEIIKCPKYIEKLIIDDCPSITSITFPTMDGLPPTLKFLDIMRSGIMEVSWLLNNFLLSLESLSFSRVSNLSFFPEGCLYHLTVLTIWDCENIESIPDNGYGFLPLLCLRELEIYNCKNLKSFPHAHLQSLASLKEMKIINCPSLDYSFPCGLWPPTLSSLEIGGLRKPISEWGLQNFPMSLVSLELYGENSGAVSFAKVEDDMGGSSSFLLPSTLTYLHIDSFNELESLSEGLQHLTSLETLSIFLCPKLRDLPETLLPSLSSLRVLYSSPEVNEKCSEEGIYWPIISQIPDLKLYLD